MPSLDTNTVNELMDRIHNETDPAQLIAANYDGIDPIELLIEYHRKNREGGLKPKKEAKAEAQKIDLAAIGVLAAPTTIGKTFRRV